MNETDKLDKKKLEAEYEDILFRLAMLRLESNDTDKLLTDMENNIYGISNKELDALSARSSDKLLSGMRRELRHEHARRLVKHTLPKVWRIAASILLIFSIGFGTALAAIPSVRIYFLEMVANFTKEYTEVQFAPSETDYVDVPKEWNGSYYPTGIPKGYEVHRISSRSGNNNVTYINENNNDITFYECDQYTAVNIDMEGTDVSYEDLHGARALVSTKNGRTVVVWSEFDKYFAIWVDGDKDVALELAASVRRIK